MMWSLKHHMEQIEKMFRLMHQAALFYRCTVLYTQKISLNSAKELIIHTF